MQMLIYKRRNEAEIGYRKLNSICNTGCNLGKFWFQKAEFH